MSEEFTKTKYLNENDYTNDHPEDDDINKLEPEKLSEKLKEQNKDGIYYKLIYHKNPGTTWFIRSFTYDEYNNHLGHLLHEQKYETGGKRRNTRHRNRKSKKTRKSRKNRRKSQRRRRSRR